MHGRLHGVFGGMHDAVSGSVMALPEDGVRDHTKEALTIISGAALVPFPLLCVP